MTGAILDRQGKQLNFEDLDEYLQYANEAVMFHRRKVGIKFPEAQKDWEHIQNELQKLKNKLH